MTSAAAARPRTRNRFDRKKILFSACVMMSLSTVAKTPEAGERCDPTQDERPFRMLNGLETQRLDANQLIIYPGSAVDNTGCEILNVYRKITVNIETTGVGGRDDVATPKDVEEMLAGPRDKSERASATYVRGQFVGKPLAGWYYVVLARELNPTTPVTAVLTRQQSSQRTDGQGSAGVPASYIYRRHLPIAYRYEPDTGFRPMVCYGWPKSVCDWTRLLPASHYLIAKGVSGTTAQTIDASKWVPGFGRILRMEIILRANKQGGGAYISTLGRSDGEFLAGYVNRPGDLSVMQLELATTSKQTFSIRTDAGITADIYAVGFSIEQPS